MSSTRTVEAIKDGTVIDHIPVGQGVKILQLFKFPETGQRVTVGFNLTSRNLKVKDIIKVENIALTERQANELALFAPNATVNVISDFKVIKKHKLKLPETIKAVFACPNYNCISHVEPIESFFYIKMFKKEIKMRCKYCERVFNKDIVASII